MREREIESERRKIELKDKERGNEEMRMSVMRKKKNEKWRGERGRTGKERIFLR